MQKSKCKNQNDNAKSKMKNAKSEIRSTKFEIRNKIKMQKGKTNSKWLRAKDKGKCG